MVIYVDVLVSLNFIMDFLLFSLASLITRIELRAIRQIPVALLSGISSLYIFFDSPNIIFDLSFRLLCSALLSFLCIGVKYKKGFFKFFLAYLASSFLIGGTMQFLSETLKLDFVAVNNTYVYLNISPIFLIVTTFIIYTSVKLFFKFRKSSRLEENCRVRLFFGKDEITFTALIDTGNKVKDILGNGEIIFISPEAFVNFIGLTPKNAEEKYKNRFRLIPVNTVTGSGIKRGIRIDKAEVYCGKNLFELQNPVLLVSENNLDNDFNLIISSDILLRMPAKTFKEEAAYVAQK